MSLAMTLLIVLLVLLVGAIPARRPGRDWGYGPSGGLGLVAVIVIALLLFGPL